MIRYYLFAFFIAFLVSSCAPKKEIVEAPVYEEREFDTMVVAASPVEDGAVKKYTPEVYRASATRDFDLIHTLLRISFDWKNQYVLGKAELTLSPWFYPSEMLELDAVNFDIHEISVDGKQLKYDYDNEKIQITLDREYTRQDTFTIFIDYTAKPNEGPTEGSLAITSSKGLFFIDPLDKDPEKPSQIWTQGETENNSRWFPTIDKPNERCSQEIFLTVDDKYETLSNGKLVNSVQNDDGTRTDHWHQEKPHAPYLFMVGVGEYAVVRDQWRKIPLSYYVEPDFKNHAKKIFAHTPEMMEFFSDALGYPYPWDKYAQIVCRDYVSGAMENTGAVVFGEFVQKTSRELLDSDNDDIVAHEMFHHWFGDLVTCESWSNLTLNEGFATYSEYLWREYKYGHDNAERKRIQDLNEYLIASGQMGYHDLIDFGYSQKDAMFDAHSYNKGGLIIHMLREYVGDEAFFTALNLYLNRHAYTDVEAHELRLVFEDVTGEDLNWFFNQWFYDKGHPILEVAYYPDEETHSITINVNQIQDPEEFPPIFRLPVKIMMYYPDGTSEMVQHWIEQREQMIKIQPSRDIMPVVTVLDGTHDLLAIIHEERSAEEYFHLFMHSDEYEDRQSALEGLRNNDRYTSVFGHALDDKSALIRSIAINNADVEIFEEKYRIIARDDSDSGNRASALRKLDDPDLALKMIQKDSSYLVIGDALEILTHHDIELAIREAERLTKSYHKPLISEIAMIFGRSGDPVYLDFFEENLPHVDMFSFFNFIKQFEKLVIKSSADRIVRTAELLKTEAASSTNYFQSFAAIKTIENLLNELRNRENSGEFQTYIAEIESILARIVNDSNDKRIKSAFKQYQVP